MSSCCSIFLSVTAWQRNLIIFLRRLCFSPNIRPKVHWCVGLNNTSFFFLPSKNRKGSYETAFAFMVWPLSFVSLVWRLHSLSWKQVSWPHLRWFFNLLIKPWNCRTNSVQFRIVWKLIYRSGSSALLSGLAFPIAVSENFWEVSNC